MKESCPVILVIDNYDSFVFNLARYFQRLGQVVEVVRNDRVSVDWIKDEVDSDRIQSVVMSPGPGTPDDAGICLDIVDQLFDKVPMLGVCLGHQVLAQALGAKVIQWDRPVHGKCHLVHHDSSTPFSGIPSPFLAARYHSLVVDESTLGPQWNVSARLCDQTVMAISHRQFPLLGYQFHPESILTQFGGHLIQGFLDFAGIGQNNNPKDSSQLQHIYSDGRVDERAELQASLPGGCRPSVDQDAHSTADCSNEIQRNRSHNLNRPDGNLCHHRESS